MCLVAEVGFREEVMPKFNEVQKRREAIAGRKRVIQGDPLTGKLKQKSQALSISGKRKRKLFRKWRRGQKETMEKDVVTMQDVEMAVAEGTSEDASKHPAQSHLMRKSLKLKVKQMKKKGKNKRKSHKPAAEAPIDTMVE